MPLALGKGPVMLRYRADIRPLSFHLVYFCLVGLAWTNGLNAWSIPLTIAICVTAFQGAIQNHNAVHCPIFHQPWMNRTYQLVLTLIYGHPSSSYVPGHNLSHHRHTQSPRDAMRTTKSRFRWHFLNGLTFMAASAPAMMRGDIQYLKKMRTHNKHWFRQTVRELLVLVVVSGALLWLDWKLALLYWFLPHLYAQWGIVTMNLLQHDGCDTGSLYDHSRNFVGKAVNWWTFNNGYHGIHHMHPGRHWSLAPESHARELAGHIHPNLEVRSLPEYLWKTFFLNRRLDVRGDPLVLSPPEPDAPWIPHTLDRLEELGAAGYGHTR